MKILIISDTHGDIDKAVEILGSNNDIDLLIHLGDYFRDAQKLADLFPRLQVEYIYGNCDFMIGDTPAEKLLEFKGKRIFITHGHRYSVKWEYDKLVRKAEETDADLVLFGHTHVADLVEKERFTLLNPGSISMSDGSSGESYALVEIKDGKINTDIVYVG